MPVAYMNDEVVVKEVQRRLQAHLPIHWEGIQYHPTHAWTVLIGGVGMGASIAAVCREGREAPSGNLVRETLNEQGWDDCVIETACNALLAQSAREGSWQSGFPVAIDLHEEPFYGKLPEDDPEVIRRGKAKSGTTSFHTFATAYVSRRHRRLTLAVTRVRAHESMLAVADRLRRRVEELGIEVQVYLLDRSIGNSNGILALAHRGHNSENALGASQRPPLATAPHLRLWSCLELKKFRWPQSQRSTAVRAAPRIKASRGQKPPGHATQDRLG